MSERATEPTLRLQYEIICRSHDGIADFRGKLLGLLPLASGTGIFLLLDGDTTPITRLLVAGGLFGAAVTLGLYFYERRGMVECLLLRSRGEMLERMLHIDESCSRFRANRPGFVGPQGAGPIVYFAVVSAWAFVAVYAFSESRPRIVLMLGLVIALTYVIAVAVAWWDLGRRRAGLAAASQ